MKASVPSGDKSHIQPDSGAERDGGLLIKKGGSDYGAESVERLESPAVTAEDRVPQNDAAIRGRDARTPAEIPLSGWKDIAFRIKSEVSEDRIGFASAGIAFYLLMGFLPTLGAVVCLYGLFADPTQVEAQLAGLRGMIPPEALEIFTLELQRIAAEDSSAGWGVVVALVVALWSGSQAMDALITALNVAYDEQDQRGFFRRKLLGLVLTVGLAVFLVSVTALLAGIPVALHFFPLGDATGVIVSVIKWPLLLTVGATGLALLYRFAPAREDARWSWLTPGSIIATLLWAGGSALFSWYASNFGNYAATYGSIAGIVVLLFWFYITGFSIMLGAEINAEIEHQTRRDTTTGAPRPPGQRGAFVADHVGAPADHAVSDSAEN